jgi:8-hydroxy-5-deazaflavin:NADPH oxidoreductase
MKQMKKSVAISGVNGEKIKGVAKELARNYRILLFSSDDKALALLADEIRETVKNTEVEPMGCPYEAGWEADVIILSGSNETEILHKIKPVATQKLVIDIAENNIDLTSLLPHSKIIRLKNFDQTEIIKHIQSILNTA